MSCGTTTTALSTCQGAIARFAPPPVRANLGRAGLLYLWAEQDLPNVDRSASQLRGGQRKSFENGVGGGRQGAQTL